GSVVKGQIGCFSGLRRLSTWDRSPSKVLKKHGFELLKGKKKKKKNFCLSAVDEQRYMESRQVEVGMRETVEEVRRRRALGPCMGRMQPGAREPACMGGRPIEEGRS
ncbi:hypothetical protein GOP47_0014202, partial [Adiantum capillus-veneris]